MLERERNKFSKPKVVLEELLKPPAAPLHICELESEWYLPALMIRLALLVTVRKIYIDRLNNLYNKAYYIINDSR